MKQAYDYWQDQPGNSCTCMWSVDHEWKTNHSYWNVNEWIETEVNKQTKHNRYETTVYNWYLTKCLNTLSIDSLSSFSTASCHCPNDQVIQACAKHRATSAAR